MFDELLNIKGARCVYVLENEFGLIKIGITDDPYKRLNTLLNVGGADIIRYSVKECVKNNTKIEKEMHNKFSKYRHNGEWFKGCKYEDVIKYFNEIIVQNEDRQKICNIVNTYGYNFDLSNINEENMLYIFDRISAICFINHIDEEKYEQLFEEIVNEKHTHMESILKNSKLKYSILELLLNVGFDFVEKYDFAYNFFKETIGFMKLDDYKPINNFKLNHFTYKQIEEHLKNKYIQQIQQNN